MISPTLAQIREWPATVSVAEAAAALGVSPSTAYEWIRSGEFPVRVISVGRCRRVVTADLVRLLGDD